MVRMGSEHEITGRFAPKNGEKTGERGTLFDF